MSTVEKIWNMQHNAMHDAIAASGATIVTFEDGTQGIMPGTAPASLLAHYARSTQVGYAKGWL
jgi:hypothetical protein